MPHITVKMYAGRTADQKEKLANALVKASIESLGVDEKFLSVSVEDYTREEWKEVYDKEIRKNKNLIVKPDYEV